jgi:predicted ATPase
VDTAAPLEQLREALAGLHDPATLERHPLAARLGGGRALRKAIEDAVAALKPRDGKAGARVERRHRLLALRYLDALPVEEVQRRLLIGRSEYYREHQAALAALGALLAPKPTAAAAPDRLPIALTSLIGRDDALAEIDRLLRASRLVTLTGAGGSGKTRLAMHAASRLAGEYADGVYPVQLAALTDPTLVPAAVAAVARVREAPGRPLSETLVIALKDQRLLLVLDNCEHLVAACAELVDALLRACPGVRVLATSREALRVDGEVTWRVPPLPVPGEVAEATAEFASVRLFVDRAGAVSPGFALTGQNHRAVGDICRHLDGLPLAIELAAARVRMLPVEQIAAHLASGSFRLLTGGSRTAAAHHQTLRASIDWSHGLLSDGERALFRRLAVFSGGWTLEAAEAVCGNPEPSINHQSSTMEPSDVLDVLTGLVDKSLVVAEQQGGDERFRLLETVREYALEQLAEHEDAAALRERHAAHYLALAERIEPELLGPELAPWRASFAELEREHDNMRAALRWLVDASETDRGLRLASALGRFWDFRGLVGEGCAWLNTLLAQPGAQATIGRARALYWAGWLPHTADVDLENRLFSAGLEVARAVDDQRTVAWTLAVLGRNQLRADTAAARALLEESLATGRRLGDVWSVFVCLLVRAWIPYEDEYAAMHAGFAEARAYARHVGTWLIADTFLEEGNLAILEGDLVTAGQLHRQALDVFREWGVLPGVAHALQGVGLVALLDGDRPLARERLTECLAIQRRMGGDEGDLPRTLRGFGALAAAEDQPARAARLFGAADTLGAASPRVVHLWSPSISAVRAALGDEAYEAAWAAGNALTLEEATAEALRGWTEPPRGDAPPASLLPLAGTRARVG